MTLVIFMSFLFLRIHFVLKLLVASIISTIYYFVIYHWYAAIYDVS